MVNNIFEGKGRAPVSAALEVAELVKNMIKYKAGGNRLAAILDKEFPDVTLLPPVPVKRSHEPVEDDRPKKKQKI